MRELVVDWIFEVAENMDVNEYTVHLAIHILDAYISVTSTLKRKDYQKAAVISLYISTKIEERYNPTISDIAFICDKAYTTNELLEMERTILETLKYDVLYDTFLICRDRICDHHGSEAKSNFYMDCLLFNPTLMYKHDIYDIVESCNAIIKKDEKYWSQCMNEIEKFMGTFTNNEKSKHVKRYRGITNL
tara:strand:- start:21775 stop:22344 length:570 start_codon:yes stop_codon:yes gene_type:complete